ncbi:MAG: hypothetical protein J5929_01875 [Eubacterium sp.]|nr:hypothetical protein [Eubacterium sp.]
MDIRYLAYTLYKMDWKNTHLTEEIVKETQSDYKKYCTECIEEGMDIPSYEDYIHDFGYNNAGVFAVFGEFYVNEYRDKEYIRSLFDSDILYKEYESDMEKFWETQNKNSPNEMREIVEDMWRFLEDQPFDEIDNEMYLANDYRFTDYHHTAPYEHTFPKGMSREEIWHWFDKKHPLGVHYLLYNADNPVMHFEDESLRIKATGLEYDFIATIENKTDEYIQFGVPELGHDCNYEIPPHDWAGIPNDKNGRIAVENIEAGNFQYTN